jgi:hypothetical protein
MAIGLFSSENFAGQNWLVTPAALAANETQPSSISDQKWLLVLTGVGLVDLQGNNPNDWRREPWKYIPLLLTSHWSMRSIPMGFPGQWG